MSLHWIFGGSGSGKSYYLYHKIVKDAALEPKTGFLVIVPEQFTMQTQKDMVELSANNSIMNIDVLSFVRLAYRVLSETPALEKPVLEDEGKGMVIRRILRDHSGEWKTFGRNIDKPGFVEEIKSIITEFLQYRVDKDELEKLQKNSENRHSLVSKLEDLELVYKYYKEYMEERYISAEEILNLLAEYASGSELLKDSVMCIDGFTGFTPIQYSLLKELLKVCKDVYITVTIDKDSNPFMPSEHFELFYMSKCFIKKCMQAAQDSSVTADDIVWTGRKKDGLPWRFVNNPQLLALENNLFRNKKNTIETDDISEDKRAFHLYEGMNPNEEVSFCVWKLRQLVRYDKLRYRDIAIVSGDSNQYGRLLKKELDNVGIPNFMDSSRSVLDNAFVDMILSLFNVVIGGFSYTKVIKFLRNAIVRDYLGFDSEGCDLLDNFLLATGIRGSGMWEKQWNYRRKGSFDLKLLNEYRVKFGEVMLQFNEKIKNCKTVLDYSKTLYEYITEYNMSDVLLERAALYEEENKPIEKKEYEQIYRIVINLLDQMTELMGDEAVTCRDYVSLLTTGFTEASVGVIPPGVDSVIIGDIQRTRLKDIKVLFFVGVNDGIIPSSVKSGGFLSDLEREYLLEKGAELAPTVKERIFTERFYLYLLVTKPSEQLYVTYSRKSSAGVDLETSPFIGEIKKILGDVEVEKNYVFWSTQARLSNDCGRNWWIGGLRQYADDRISYDDLDPRWLEINREWLESNNGTDTIESAFYSGENSQISGKIANILYGKEITGSVSRLEKYAACAFSHYLQYGLNLKERKEYKVDVPDIGTLFHEIIERFSNKLNDNSIKWRDLDENMIKEWTCNITDAVCEAYGDGVLMNTGRDSYMKDRMLRIVTSTINALSVQMKAGEFEAKAYEISFENISDINSLNLELEDNNVMHLVGRIDRIDACEKDDKVYIKVIDYKSGNEKFDMLKMYYGLKMQLIVYLGAAKELGQKDYVNKLVIPAGAFYFHVDDPVVESLDIAEETDSLTKSRLFAEYKLNGFINSSLPVPYLLDEALKGPDYNLKAGVVSNVVPVAVTKGGSYDVRRSSVIESSIIDKMSEHINEKMTRFGNEIMAGNTQISPYKLGEENPCSYCNFKPVCCFESKLPGNRYRQMKKISSSEIMKIIGDDSDESK